MPRRRHENTIGGDGFSGLIPRRYEVEITRPTPSGSHTHVYNARSLAEWWRHDSGRSLPHLGRGSVSTPREQARVMDLATTLGRSSRPGPADMLPVNWGQSGSLPSPRFARVGNLLEELLKREVSRAVTFVVSTSPAQFRASHSEQVTEVRVRHIGGGYVLGTLYYQLESGDAVLLILVGPSMLRVAQAAFRVGTPVSSVTLEFPVVQPRELVPQTRFVLALEAALHRSGHAPSFRTFPGVSRLVYDRITAVRALAAQSVAAALGGR